ncbi:MAG: RHS repeat-associated core domain-containing protein [Acidobacteria bacterium]|nr:RHS repeat-associated core domain-containing protein [Acidobacteriota bacterium]
MADVLVSHVDSITTTIWNSVRRNPFTSGQGYTYDAAGNVLTDAEGRSFYYDAENKQKEVKNASNQTIGLYYFDGDGRRVKKVTNTETVIFVFDAAGKLVADDVRQGFTGYLNDEETNLDYAQARMYKKELGRFTGADPLLASATLSSPASWNRYKYALNNPLSYVDPLGLFEWADSAGGSASNEDLEDISKNGATKKERRKANRQLRFRLRFEAALKFAPEKEMTLQKDRLRRLAR